MQHFHINYLALVVAAIARFLLGWLWYSPPLFGKTWMSLTNCNSDEMKRRMPVLAPADLISNFVMAFVLVHAVHYAGAMNAGQGAAVGFFNWLGFIATVTLMLTLYEKRPVKLFWINSGFQLISLLIMGGIVAVWV
jgi:Protein of unknown function (DUF1761)